MTTTTETQKRFLKAMKKKFAMNSPDIRAMEAMRDQQDFKIFYTGEKGRGMSHAMLHMSNLLADHISKEPVIQTWTASYERLRLLDLVRDNPSKRVVFLDDAAPEELPTIMIGRSNYQERP